LHCHTTLADADVWGYGCGGEQKIVVLVEEDNENNVQVPDGVVSMLPSNKEPPQATKSS
jgi:hypothetical protein